MDERLPACPHTYTYVAWIGTVDRMADMKKIVAGCCLWLAAAFAGAGDCADWHGLEFVKTATPALVTDCLAEGASLQARDDRSLPPLHEAAWSTGDPGVIAVLLNGGADPREQAADGSTPLVSVSGSGIRGR